MFDHVPAEDESFSKVNVLSVFGFTHAVVDAVCAAILYRLYVLDILDLGYLLKLFLIYNVIAFGTQFIFGLFVDKFHAPKFTAIVSCIFLIAAVLLFVANPLFAIVLAGLGNSLFHVGGGAISLKISPKKAGPPGIFVAPGALGLLVGVLYGKSLFFTPVVIILVLVLCIFMMYFTRIPKVYGENKNIKVDWLFLLVFMLLFSVSVRSLIGMAIISPWKTNLLLLFFLTLGVSLGKAMGGIVSDRFGWQKIAVGCLLLSAPFLAFGSQFVFFGILGAFLFQMTMPVTLVAISRALPNRPGFAFGIPCLALIIGALPIFTSYKIYFSNYLVVLLFIFASAIMLWWGLRLLFLNKDV